MTILPILLTIVLARSNVPAPVDDVLSYSSSDVTLPGFLSFYQEGTLANARTTDESSMWYGRKILLASHDERILLDSRSRLESETIAARSILETSSGRVDDEDTRTMLASLLQESGTIASGNDHESMDSLRGRIVHAVTVVESSVSDRVARLKRETEEKAAAERSASSSSTSSSGSSGGASSTSTTVVSSSQSSSSQSTSSTGSASSSIISVWSSGSCTPSTADPACQAEVNTGGLIKISYYNGATIDYAQHRGTGGAWILSLTVGEHVRVNGVEYRVTGITPGATYAPSSGTYLQTCATDGSGNRLVAITRI